jgi:hypothetical protein
VFQITRLHSTPATRVYVEPLRSDGWNAMAQGVGKVLLEHALEARSPLYRWMHEHYAELAPVLASKPAWTALAKTAKDAGIGEPSKQVVRATWQRVEKDMKATRRASPAAVVSPPPRIAASLPPRPADEPVPTPNPQPASPAAVGAFKSMFTEHDQRARRYLPQTEPPEPATTGVTTPLSPEEQAKIDDVMDQLRAQQRWLPGRGK